MPIDDSKTFEVSVLSEYITNSNGGQWDAVGSNIKLAINDLGTGGGTVWLPSTGTSPLVVSKVTGTTYCITVPSNVTITYLGPDPANCVVKLADNQVSSPTSFIDLFRNANQSTGNTNIEISNFKIDGNGLNQIYGTDNHKELQSHSIFFRKVTDSHIHDMQIHHNSCMGILDWEGTGNLIENVDASWCGEILEGTGKIDEAPAGILSYNTDGAIIRNCQSHDCYGNGICVDSHWQAEPWNIDLWSKNWLIENCTSWNNYGGFWTEKCHDGTLTECYAYDNIKTEAYADFGGGSGFIIGNNSWNITNINCKSQGNLWRGYHCAAWTNVVYTNCQSINNGYGGTGSPRGGFIIFSNSQTTIPGVEGCHTLQNCTSTNSSTGGYGIWYWTYNPTVLNNTLSGNGTGRGIYCSADSPATNQYGEIADNTISNYPTPIYNNLANVYIHDN